MRIALLCPSRGRARRFGLMVDSALMLAANPHRVTPYLMVDADDPELKSYEAIQTTLRFVNKERGRTVPALLNDLAQIASEDILFAVSDDIIFRTLGWDDILVKAFGPYPDGLLVAYTNDGLDRDKCTHFAVTQRWVELAGHITEPSFEHFYADEYVHTIGSLIRRTVFLRNLVTEHMHYRYKKSEQDETYASKRGNGTSRRDGTRMKALMPQVTEISQRMKAVMA